MNRVSLPGIIGILAAVMLMAGGCSLSGGTADATDPLDLDSITVSSNQLIDGAPLPREYSCHGAGKTPPLKWSGLPAKTESVAVVIDDADVNSGAFVHWLVVNIEPGSSNISEDRPPEGARQANNSSGKSTYSPPCTKNHRYRVTVYALDRPIALPVPRSLPEVMASIAERTIARGRIITSHIV